MNKTVSFLLAVILATTSQVSFTMQPEQEGIGLAIRGQLIPNNVTINHTINGPSANSLFSLLGFIASCFGVALVYQGFQKIAEPVSSLPPVRNSNVLNPLPPIEPEINTVNVHGKWLTTGGLLLATAGIVAIFHQKIFQ